jgi:hypothetical protein
MHVYQVYRAHVGYQIRFGVPATLGELSVEQPKGQGWLAGPGLLYNCTALHSP